MRSVHRSNYKISGVIIPFEEDFVKKAEEYDIKVYDLVQNLMIYRRDNIFADVHMQIFMDLPLTIECKVKKRMRRR